MIFFTQCSLFTMEPSVSHTDLSSENLDLLCECSYDLCTLLDAVIPFITNVLNGMRQVSSYGISTALYFSNYSFILYQLSSFLVSSNSFINFFIMSSIGICTLSNFFLFLIFLARVANLIVEMVYW